MSRRLRKPKRCANSGAHPMCVRKNLATCILFENPHMKPGPCSRMEEDSAKQVKPKKYTLLEALFSKGPIIDRLIRYALGERSDQERKEELNRELFSYSTKGDVFGVRICLLLGAEPDARDENGKTPLMRIADAPHRSSDDWGDVIDIRDQLLVTAQVLSIYKPDISARDHEGMTAKEIAEKNDFYELAAIL